MNREQRVECVGEWNDDSRDGHVHARHGLVAVRKDNAAEIDRALRSIAKQRAGLDAEEAKWLRRADAQAIWPALGYVHALEYLEDVFAYSPRTAHDRLRVARELGELPLLEAELTAGRLPYASVRELTRVATPKTEASWIDAVRGRNYRQIEQLVAGHRKGDLPDDDIDPALIPHRVTLHLDGPSHAMLRQARAVLSDEVGEHLDDDAFVEALCRRALEGDAAQASGPARMVHITTCRSCKTTTQTGAGVRMPLDDVEREVALCDAVIVDDEAGKRAASKIPPKTRREVFERDGYRCRFPGCRATRNLDVHHFKPRAQGGSHDKNNLLTQCGGHHRLVHDGTVAIERRDNEFVFLRRGHEIRGERDAPVVDERPLLVAVTVDDGNGERKALVAAPAEDTNRERDALVAGALTQAGYTAKVAANAVARATKLVAADATLEVLLREALRHCG
jgi:hypothetical protein